MKEPTFFVPNLVQCDKRLFLPDSEAHHAFSVLRIRATQTCFLIDNCGHRAMGTVLSDRSIRIETCQQVTRPFGRIRWMVSWLPVPKLKQVIEVGTVLGIECIFIVSFDRTQGLASQLSLKRLYRVCQAAQKVAVMPFCPEIRPSTLKEVIAAGHHSMWVFHQRGQMLEADPRCVLSSELPLVCIGPEGGFTDAEIDAFVEMDARVCSLGDVNIPSVVAPGLATMFLMGSKRLFSTLPESQGL